MNEPCSCGDRTRPHINHRKRIPCWTYLGSRRTDILPDGSCDHSFDDFWRAESETR